MDPFAEKEEELHDPFAETRQEKEDALPNPFAQPEKKEEKAENLVDPFAQSKKELSNPFAQPKEEKNTFFDPFASTDFSAHPIPTPQSTLQHSVNQLFSTSNKPVIVKKPSLRRSADLSSRLPSRPTPHADLFSSISSEPQASLFDGLSATPTQSSQDLFTFDSVSPVQTATPLTRLEKHEMLSLSNDSDYADVAQRIGVFLTPMADVKESVKPTQVIDVVSFFADDADFSTDIEDGQRLRVIFDNMLPVINDKPVLPDPEEMDEQVERKAEALEVLLTTLNLGWGKSGVKKKLQRQIRSVLDEKCSLEATHDIAVCEKCVWWGGLRRRAMKKVSKVVDAKQKAMETVAKGMKKLDDQKNLLVQAVEVRLKEFVDQKNRLVESMNKMDFPKPGQSGRYGGNHHRQCVQFAGQHCDVADPGHLPAGEQGTGQAPVRRAAYGLCPQAGVRRLRAGGTDVYRYVQHFPVPAVLGGVHPGEHPVRGHADFRPALCHFPLVPDGGAGADSFHWRVYELFYRLYHDRDDGPHQGRDLCHMVPAGAAGGGECDLSAYCG